MKFPDHYTVLNKNFFENGSYQLVPIRYKDRLDIMKWRNEQIYHLRQSKPLTEEDQEYYFQNTVSKLFTEEKPSQLLFSLLKDGDLIGYGGLVHINWIDRNAEISFIMDTALEEKEFDLHWGAYLRLIEKVSFKILNFHKIYIYAFDLRPHLYQMAEKNGYFKDAILKEHCMFDGSFIDVVFYSKLNK